MNFRVFFSKICNFTPPSPLPLQLCTKEYLTKMRVFLQILETVNSLKDYSQKKNNFNSASTTNQTNKVEDYIFKKNSTCSSYQSQLKAYCIFPS